MKSCFRMSAVMDWVTPAENASTNGSRGLHVLQAMPAKGRVGTVAD